MGCIHNWIISEARRFRGVRIEEDEMTIDLECMGIRDQIAGTQLVTVSIVITSFLKMSERVRKAKTGTLTFIYGQVQPWESA
jgi:hypothetical protein